jgi:hypothetical protein
VVAACAGSFVLAAAAALTCAGSATAAGANYVALGDSYSSGVGSGDYTDESGDCDRSPHAYAQLWANTHSPASFHFDACSGARTSDVKSNQLGDLNSSTTLVSITIGGNDAGFSDVMTTCVESTDSGCQDRLDTADAYIDSTLPGLLDSTYADIKAKAPSAKVVVLGYPRMYKVPGDCVVGLSDTKRTAIDNTDAHLDSVIKARAQAAGFTFEDANQTFTGHEICSDDVWLHSLNWLDIGESYHPTADGQQYGYLPLLDQATG